MSQEKDVAGWSSSEECVLGIDEAGRGPVLGPMVYAAAFCALSSKPALHKLGVDDSKQLKESERDTLRGKIETADFIGYEERVVSAEELSTKMLHKSRTSLNVISHNAALDLVRSAMRKGVNVSEVYVDTVGNPKKYAAKFYKCFPLLKRVVVETKADSRYPIVGTASIVAKTTRDRCLREWWFKEEAQSGNVITFARTMGSGYPNDPLTKAWLRDHIDPVFGFPTLVRFSWSTAKSLLRESAVNVEWENEGDDEEGDAVAQRIAKLPERAPSRSKKSSGADERSGNRDTSGAETSWLSSCALLPATSM